MLKFGKYANVSKLTYTFSSKVIQKNEKNLLKEKILRCRKKCLCYQHIIHKHCHITDYETDMINRRVINNKNNSVCFYDYDGARQFKFYNLPDDNGPKLL